jgi:hypothetical protein
LVGVNSKKALTSWVQIDFQREIQVPPNRGRSLLKIFVSILDKYPVCVGGDRNYVHNWEEYNINCD